MKKWTWAVAAAACAVVVAGCGGGGGGSTTTNSTGFSQLVSFGDSLSDIGTYKVGSVAALGGGKFTVNSPTAKNWTELIAAQYGLPAPCPAMTGLPSVLIPSFSGAATQTFSLCRNYAQGSSRATVAYGPNSLAIQQFIYQAYGGALGGTAAVTAAANAAGIGLTAIPVVAQMNNHLAAVGGAYSGKELVTVMAGGNDVFMNLNGVSSVATSVSTPTSANIQGAVIGATFAGWSNPNQYATANAAALSAAQAAAVGGMAQAANDLVGYINTLVLAKGAKYVAVVNLPDVSRTPYGLTFDAPTQAFVRTMVTTFNSTLAAGLAGKSGVLLIDAYTQNNDQLTNPASYGITNATSPACSATSSANPLQGSSLTCTAASTVAGDVSKYAFADTVHPTPYGYQLLAQYVSLKLIAAGWQ